MSRIPRAAAHALSIATMASIAIIGVAMTQSASAQDGPKPPPNPSADGTAAAAPQLIGTVQKLRGLTAWRRAVWAMDRSGFQLASRDLHAARALQAERPDHTTSFLLGLSIALAGDAANAREHLARRPLIGGAGRS